MSLKLILARLIQSVEHDCKKIGTKLSVQHIMEGHHLLTDKLDIANKLGETLAKHSSSSNYDPNFQKYQKQQGKKRADFTSQNGEDYNEAFSLHELNTALGQDTGADNTP